MNIERFQIPIRDLIFGYKEIGVDGIEGVVAFGGLLDVRPAYQREYIYGTKDRDEVIRSIKKRFPINVMYWVKTVDGRYEIMDGQQRTISICRYAACKDKKNRETYEQCYSVDGKYFFNLPSDIKEEFYNYKLDVYICDGTPSEVMDWFRIINIAGKPLLEQELRNISYTGPWLSDAKIYFSKPNCVAYSIAKDYLNGSPIRQEYLKTAIEWIAARDGVISVDEYMGLHQHDDNAYQLRIYFKRVIEWVQTIFPNKRKEMKGIDWGLLYNSYKDAELDPDKLEQKIKELMIDDDVSNKKGIYTYVLTGDERHLNIRAFTEKQKREAYERQNGICPDCLRHFSFDEMQGDHITPWSKGGSTTSDNCKMRCADCNRRKSNI